MEIETIKQDVGSKRKSAALDHVKTVKRLITDSKLISPCRDAKICESALDGISKEVDTISASLKDSMDTVSGSEQERKALDQAYLGQTKMSKFLTTLEEQMVPANYELKVPSAYDDLPQLRKRATVEMVVRKPDKSPFDVEGQNYPEAKMTMIIDGYAGKCCNIQTGDRCAPKLSHSHVQVLNWYSHILVVLPPENMCHDVLVVSMCSSCHEWQLY